jgi:hypothetical protein
MLEQGSYGFCTGMEEPEADGIWEILHSDGVGEGRTPHNGGLRDDVLWLCGKDLVCGSHDG